MLIERADATWHVEGWEYFDEQASAAAFTLAHETLQLRSREPVWQSEDLVAEVLPPEEQRSVIEAGVLGVVQRRRPKHTHPHHPR